MKVIDFVKETDLLLKELSLYGEGQGKDVIRKKLYDMYRAGMLNASEEMIHKMDEFRSKL